MAQLKLARMHLTDDDIHTVTAGRFQSVRVRVRVWRRMGARAVVLVEAEDPGRSLRPWAGRVAVVVNREVTNGNTEYSYVEREGEPRGPDERFLHVHFAVHRLRYVTGPWRDTLTRRDVEFQVGGPV